MEEQWRDYCRAAWDSGNWQSGRTTNIDAGGACCLALCLTGSIGPLGRLAPSIAAARLVPAGKRPGSLAANRCRQGRESVRERADDITYKGAGWPGCTRVLPYSVPHTSREGSRSCSARRLRQQQRHRDADGEHQQGVTLEAQHRSKDNQPCQHAGKLAPNIYGQLLVREDISSSHHARTSAPSACAPPACMETFGSNISKQLATARVIPAAAQALQSSTQQRSHRC